MTQGWKEGKSHDRMESGTKQELCRNGEMEEHRRKEGEEQEV